MTRRSTARAARPSRIDLTIVLGVVLLGSSIACSPTNERSDRSNSNEYAGWVRRIETAVETGRAPEGLLARAIEHPDAVVRREAARAIGILDPPGSVTFLVPRLDVLEVVEVRTEAIHALGLLHRPEALPHLIAILDRDPDPRLRRLAAVALGRLEGEGVAPAAVAALIDGMADPDPGVRGGAALATWHHGEAAAAAIDRLVVLLGTPGDDVRWRAAFALARIEAPETTAKLRAYLGDPQPWVRTFAARGMRSPADATSIEPLGVLLADPASPTTARIEALRSLAALRESFPDRSDEIRDTLLEHLMRETHPGSREALIEALATSAGEIELPFILATLERAEDATTRRAAIRAIGKVAGEEALELLEEFADGEDPWTRVAAATALGEVGAAAGPLLTAMLRDDDRRVRTAAAASVAKIEAAFRWPLLETVLADPDLAVRTTAVSAFAEEKPQGWIEALAATWQRSRDPEYWELRVIVLDALAEKAGATATVLAEVGIHDPFLTVRISAAKILGVPVPRADEAPPPRGLPYPRLDDPFRNDENLRATIETDHGPMVVELYLEAAPRHVSGFVGMARQGNYDGLIFHRVVPSFVVQGADPRSDGWGDAGYHLVDEIHPVEYVRGTLGMPKAGDHTGGAQIFITHLPTPRLDGRYTVFGQVIEGLEVLDRLEVGDRIRRVTVEGLEDRRASF